MERKEIIKEERLKEIEFFEYGINLIDYGLSSIEEEKYKEIIPLIYFEKLRMEDVAEKFSVDTSTIKRNRNKLVEIMSLSIFDSEILKDLIKNIF